MGLQVVSDQIYAEAWRGSMMGAGVIRVGLSWGRTLEPRELGLRGLGLRGFRTLSPPSTGDSNRAQPRRPAKT